MNFTDFILIIYLTPLIRRYSNFILYKRKCEILSYFCFLLGGGGGREEGEEGGGGRREGRGRKVIHGKLSSTIINNAVQTGSILTQAAIIKQRGASSKSFN